MTRVRGRCALADGVKLTSAYIYSELCMGRQRINVILSSSHNVIYCARHISAHSAYTIRVHLAAGSKVVKIFTHLRVIIGIT